MFKRSLVLFAGLFAVLAIGSTAVQAQPMLTPGWYLSGEGGWVHENGPDGTFTVHDDPSWSLKMNEGWGIGAAVGYAGLFSPNIRAEGELVHRQNGVNGYSVVVPPTVSGGATGHIDSNAIMANGYWDFFTDRNWTPYIGAGIGAANVSMNDVIATTPGGAGAAGRFSANDWQFAYQGIAGLRYQFTPAFSVGLDYRYFATTDPSFHVKVLGTSQSVKTQYETHNVFLHLTYSFGAPPPPPPAPVPAAAPAPAPPPAPRVFIVFFDFDKDVLTADGEKIVAQAADAYKKGGSARIQVVGYTDLAGSQQYNLGLSERRAKRVQTQLVKDGVPANAIATTWRGKENPRVPTADGVREPQNRRVEITL